MKKFFDKDNFSLSTYSKSQKRQSLVTSILILVSFVLSAFTFFNAFYSFVDAIGSIVSGSFDVAIKDLLRDVPLFLVFLMSFWMLLLFHAQFRNVSTEKRNKSLLKDSITILAFALINVIYIVIGLIVGKYLSIVEGSPSYLFPLDTILYSLLPVAVAVFVLIYLAKNKDKYDVPQRGSIVMKARGLYCTFMTFWALIAAFSFSAAILSIFIYDFAHEYVFYGIMIIVSFILSALYLGVWEFYYNELKDEKKKELLLPLSICGLVLSIVVAALYFISLGTGMDAPSNAGFGMLPVAFAASVNIATIIVVVTPLIVSIVALIKGLILRKK